MEKKIKNLTKKLQQIQVLKQQSAEGKVLETNQVLFFFLFFSFLFFFFFFHSKTHSIINKINQKLEKIKSEDATKLELEKLQSQLGA